MFEYRNILLPEIINPDHSEDQSSLYAKETFVSKTIDENVQKGWELVLIERINMKPYKRLIDSFLMRKVKKVTRLSIIFRKTIS